jgi:hypothetical protein
MMPLFEAISNSMDSIEQKRRGVTKGHIRIQLVSRADLVQQSEDYSLAVDGFDVVDDGVGFTPENLASFGEAYTLSKATTGGKGVGRFTFLKVFRRTTIDSVDPLLWTLQCHTERYSRCRKQSRDMRRSLSGEWWGCSFGAHIGAAVEGVWLFDLGDAMLD